MRVIVTGGLGHIGSALIRDPRFRGAVDEMVIVDDLSTQRFSSVYDLPEDTRYTVLQGDVAARLTPDVLEGADAVIHLAAITDPTASFKDPQGLYENNLRITKHAVETCDASQVPLVFVSTTSVYTSPADVVDEDCSDLDPSSPYAQCKLEEERLVLERLGAGQSMVFRLGTIFGTSPGMRFHTAVNRFCWQAALGEPIQVWSTAMDQVRPYLSVGDAVGALTRTVAESIFPGQLVNAVTCNVTVREVLDAITESGHRVEVNTVDSPAMNELSFAASVGRATALGYSFPGDLKSDVSETMALLGTLGPR